MIMTDVYCCYFFCDVEMFIEKKKFHEVNKHLYLYKRLSLTDKFLRKWLSLTHPAYDEDSSSIQPVWVKIVTSIFVSFSCFERFHILWHSKFFFYNVISSRTLLD